jgi:hypothetical protein
MDLSRGASSFVKRCPAVHQFSSLFITFSTFGPRAGRRQGGRWTLGKNVKVFRIVPKCSVAAEVRLKRLAGGPAADEGVRPTNSVQFCQDVHWIHQFSSLFRLIEPGGVPESSGVGATSPHIRFGRAHQQGIRRGDLIDAFILLCC